MQFHLELPTLKYDFQLSHSDKIITIGSCFSEEIANKLDKFKFQILKNPFGIVFHPFAIKNALERCINLDFYTKNEVFKQNEIFFNWDFHSKFNQLDEELFLESINKTVKETHEFLKDCSVVFITLGTSFVYELKENNKIVANCHKVSSSNFNKKLLSESEIQICLMEIVANLNKFNAKIKIIFTVSPVRHIKDGIVENNVSKGRLLSTIYEINKEKNTYYFPSYELMIDDLRDYRFFKEDLIHPNEMALNYIWEKFSISFFNEKTIQINKEINHIHNELNHKPFNPNSEEYVQFKFKTEQKIKKLNLEYAVKF